MVQEFHLSVKHLHDEEFYIRVERVEKGVPLAEEQVSWPVEKWLAQARQVFTDPLSEFFQASPEDPYEMIPVDPLSSASGLPTEPALIALGQELHEALFQGTVRDSWVMAQGVAQHRQERLRLRLGLKGDLLTRLPWEVLHAGNRPIAASDDVMFSRTQGKLNPLASIHERLAVQPSLSSSLHILMVLAAPTDQANLELKREALHLKEELQSHRSSDSYRNLPDIQLTLLEQPGREQLTQELERADYQVFHFAGHSSPGPSGGLLHLVNSHSGLTESLSGDDLAGLLANNGIRLAVLNSCFGTQAATSNEFDLQGERTLAEALIRRGIPGVLAMAERIPDQVALTLSRLFYRNLKFGQPLDLSLCRARQGLISAYGSNQLYWALPILYLQSDFEGCLVEVTGSSYDGLDQSSIANESASAGGVDLSLNSPPFQENSEPALAGSGEPTYRGGGALAEPPSLANDSLLLNRPDPDIANAVTRLEADLLGEGASSRQSQAEDPPPSNLGTPTHKNQAQTATDASSELALRSESTAAVTSSTRGKVSPQELNPQEIKTNPSILSLRNRGPVMWLLAGAAGMLLLGGGIWGISRSVRPVPRGYSEPTETASGNSQALADDIEVGLINRDFETVIKSMEKLLDDNNPDVVQSVLDLSVNWDVLQASGAETAAEYTFLVGRMKWQQFTARGPNPNQAAIADTSTSSAEEELNAAVVQWRSLVESYPNNLKYRNAYGFALLAQKEVATAKEFFEETLKLIDDGKAEPKQESKDSGMQQARAGWALALFRLSNQQNVGERKQHLERAIKIYQSLVKAKPREYSFTSLSTQLKRTWIWTPQMLEDWQELERQSISRK